MHTATRLAGPVIAAARRANPAARICAFGLYAPLNAEWLRGLGVDEIFGGEFEEDLAAWAGRRWNRRARQARRDKTILCGLCGTPRFMPGVSSAADSLPRPRSDGPAAAVEIRDAADARRRAPAGRLHRGQPRLPAPVPALSGRADLQRTVPRRAAGRRRSPTSPRRSPAGARHITFGDPDFFNGPTHAMRIVDGAARSAPGRQLRRHDQGRAPAAASRSRAAAGGDRLRLRDERGRIGRRRGAAACSTRDTRGPTSSRPSRSAANRASTLVPTFVAFHPWLTLDAYCDLLDTIDALDLVDHVAPIQLAIRLLVPQGSRLLELDDMRVHLGAFDPETLTYRWAHPDAARRRAAARRHGPGRHPPHGGSPAVVRRGPRRSRTSAPAARSRPIPGPFVRVRPCRT